MTQQSQALDELLPCPFCGQSRVYLNAPSTTFPRGSINCPACMVVMPGEVGEAELIETWNRRTLGGTPAKQGEATILSEALRRIIALTPAAANSATPNDLHLTVKTIASVALDNAAALSQHPVALAVKPLEWETTGDNDADDIAETICGQFWVADTNIGYRLYFIYEADGSIYQSVLGTQLGREAAKAAAQSHYETTIRSALIASPVPAKADGGVTAHHITAALAGWDNEEAECRFRGAAASRERLMKAALTSAWEIGGSDAE